MDIHADEATFISLGILAVFLYMKKYDPVLLSFTGLKDVFCFDTLPSTFSHILNFAGPGIIKIKKETEVYEYS